MNTHFQSFRPKKREDSSIQTKTKFYSYIGNESEFINPKYTKGIKKL